MRVDGPCHCGEITYRAQVDPQRVVVCHCTGCQILGGTAFRASVPVSATDFVLLSGMPRTYVKIAAGGKRRAQVFYPNCGTPHYAPDAQEPKTHALRCALRRCASVTLCRRTARSAIARRSPGRLIDLIARSERD